MLALRCQILSLFVCVPAGLCIAQTTTPTGEAPPEIPRVISPLEKGDDLMSQKMYRDAIEAYEAGVREAAVMYNKIGIAYHQLMEFRSALGNYNMALSLNPRYAEVMNNIGALYYGRKDYARAISQYRKALEIAPKSASIYSNLGTAYFARKQYDRAFEAYQQALALDPSVFEHRSSHGTLLQERSVEERAKFHFYLAKTYAQAGMPEQALLYMRRALEEGFRERDKFVTDPAFKDMQELEEFQILLAMEPRVL